MPHHTPNIQQNVLTTYLSMLFLADYAFSWQNFVGLNVSILGSFIYSAAEIQKNRVGQSVDPWNAESCLCFVFVATARPCTTPACTYAPTYKQRTGAAGGGSAGAVGGAATSSGTVTGKKRNGSGGSRTAVGTRATPSSPTTSLHKAI